MHVEKSYRKYIVAALILVFFGTAAASANQHPSLPPRHATWTRMRLAKATLAKAAKGLLGVPKIIATKISRPRIAELHKTAQKLLEAHTSLIGVDKKGNFLLANGIKVSPRKKKALLKALFEMKFKVDRPTALNALENLAYYYGDPFISIPNSDTKAVLNTQVHLIGSIGSIMHDKRYALLRDLAATSDYSEGHAKIQLGILRLATHLDALTNSDAPRRANSRQAYLIPASAQNTESSVPVIPLHINDITPDGVFAFGKILSQQALNQGFYNSTIQKQLADIFNRIPVE